MKIQVWVKRSAGLALAAALLAAASAVPAAAPVASAGWMGQWMGSASTVTSAMLADVRTMIGASAWPASWLTGAGVGVALIDTGVAPVDGLPAGQIVNGPDLSFESQSPALRYLDTYGHGTHMAGIIVGNGANTGNVGIAPGVKLTSIKVGTASGAVDVTQMIAALDWVVQHRNDDPSYPIRVVNLAYGTGGTPSHLTDPVMAAVEQAWKAGIVVVAAAGNGPHTKMSDPASDPFILSVGSAATNGTVSNADDTASTFNNGSNATITYYVVAPGEGIVSLRNPGSSIDNDYPAARQGDYMFRGSGSSQATAVASAAVALLLQARPSLKPDDVVQVLMASATTIAGGRKMINVANAVNQPVPAYTPRTLYSTGAGLLEAARGTSHVVVGTTVLSGENSIFGPFSTSAWVARSMAQTAWSGGVWMGNRFAGDGWNGSSWASRTWGSATWSGLNWAGQAWADPSWDGHYWSGHYWSGGSWSGHYWTSDDWSAAYWG